MQVSPECVHADPYSLIHGLLDANDLVEHGVDHWINNFPGATHLVDVYSGRRVGKRVAFPSRYTRLQLLQDIPCPSAENKSVRTLLLAKACSGHDDAGSQRILHSLKIHHLVTVCHGLHFTSNAFD